LENLHVSKEADGRVALLTLARPQHMNALSSGLLRDLEQAISEAEDTPEVGAVVVTGEGRAFCGGADIAELRASSRSEAAAYIRRIQGVCNRVEASRFPVLAAVGGVAFGGGFELALACDLVVAEEQSRFAVPEVKLGLIPGGGGTQRLPRLVGRNRAKELLYFGEPITADQALAFGVVNRVVEKGESLDEALRWATELSERPPLAVGIAKRVVNQGIQADLQTGLELEAQGIGLLFGTRDQVEGMNAFLEKRAAKFIGE
jgi:enoyl-CoA hydratase/carnithine racemase